MKSKEVPSVSIKIGNTASFEIGEAPQSWKTQLTKDGEKQLKQLYNGYFYHILHEKKFSVLTEVIPKKDDFLDTVNPAYAPRDLTETMGGLMGRLQQRFPQLDFTWSTGAIGPADLDKQPPFTREDLIMYQKGVTIFSKPRK